MVQIECVRATAASRLDERTENAGAHSDVEAHETQRASAGGVGDPELLLQSDTVSILSHHMRYIVASECMVLLFCLLLNTLDHLV